MLGKKQNKPEEYIKLLDTAIKLRIKREKTLDQARKIYKKFTPEDFAEYFNKLRKKI